MNTEFLKNVSRILNRILTRKAAESSSVFQMGSLECVITGLMDEFKDVFNIALVLKIH